MSRTTLVEIATSTGVRLSVTLGSRHLAEYAGMKLHEKKIFNGEEGVNFMHRPVFMSHFSRSTQDTIRALFKIEQDWEDNMKPEMPVVTDRDYNDHHTPYEYFVLSLHYLD